MTTLPPHDPRHATHPTRATRRAAARSVNRRGTVLVAAAALLSIAACGGGGESSEPSGPTIPPNSEAIIDASATAMGDVQSVEFELLREGAPVFIDSFDAIALNRATGQFTVPRSAQALLEVEVNGSLTTELGAVALDDEIWLSNPVTGAFETLPAGYDIDPSLFFDPENGWKPLMANLTDVELVGTDDIDGVERYHIRGIAPAEQVSIITARLVRNQDVEIDFWIQPVTGLVSRAEFSTETGTDDSATIDWTLDLSGYGEPFEIIPPENVTGTG